MTTQITTIGDLLQACKNSPLENILNSLVNQDFASITEEMDGKEGAVVTRMNPLEMALYTGYIKMTDKCNALIESHNRIVAELNEENRELAKDKLQKLSAQINSATKAHKILESIMWNTIKGRLYNDGIFETESLSIRSDGSIVSHPVEEDDLLGELGQLGMFLNGMMSGAAHTHNCDDCPDYDECDLPIKKPR